ncbi:MAG: GTP-binding protein, partial [Candidatus Omnitrophota bacterium]
MIPVCLATGFLGSGKTTLLQRIADQRRQQRLVYIVNEFASIDIDGQRLHLPEGQMIAIPGGSIFCRCLTGEFIRVLRSVADRIGEDGSVEGVIIEASGISDPGVIRQMLHETKLDGVYSLRRIISVADPQNLLKLIHTLPNIVKQIQVSDQVLLNKTDCYPPDVV